ncbi:uncharacterized protein [Nothobranchius furzeri]
MGLRQGCVESTGPGWGRLGLPGPGRPGTGGNGAYDNNPNSDRSGEDLSDACLSFQSSIELEGQHQRGEPPQQLNKQTWWREHLEAQNKEAALQTTTWQSPAKIPSKTNTTKRGAKQGRGCPTQGWAGGTRAPTTAPAGPPTTRGGKAARLPAKAPAGRGRAGAAAKPDKSAKPAGNSPKAKLLSDKSEQDCCPKPVHEERVSVSGPLNRRSHVARLGLARVLSRSIDTQNEAEQLYQEVIAMAPENHNAYIQLVRLHAGALRPPGCCGRLLQVPPEARGRAKLQRRLHQRRDRSPADVTEAARPLTAGPQPGSTR